jgi:hypothetical protein
MHLLIEKVTKIGFNFNIGNNSSEFYFKLINYY